MKDRGSRPLTCHVCGQGTKIRTISHVVMPLMQARGDRSLRRLVGYIYIWVFQSKESDYAERPSVRLSSQKLSLMKLKTHVRVFSTVQGENSGSLHECMQNNSRNNQEENVVRLGVRGGIGRDYSHWGDVKAYSPVPGRGGRAKCHVLSQGTEKSTRAILNQLFLCASPENECLSIR